MAFSDDGTKLFVLEIANNTITTHNLGTAYDISTQTSSVTGTTLASNPHAGYGSYGIEFSTDGTKMFTSDVDNGYVYQWTLTTPWDVSTNQRSSSDDLNTTSLFGVTIDGGLYNRDITFSEDGTKLFILGSDKTVHQISLGTAWDLSTRITSPTDVEKDLSSILTTGRDTISFSPNGKKMFINEFNKKIHEWSIATAWDLSSTVTYEGSFQSGAEINSSNYGEVTWNKDGTKFFILDSAAEDITEYSVTTPFSLANVDQTKSAESISSVSSIRTGTVAAGSGTSGTINGTTNGTYGTLTINSNGSYTYLADKTVTDALDPGDVVYDYFTINGDTDLTITVIGINDTPSADNETNSTDVSTTLTVTDGASDLLTNDSDDDADASLTVSAIRIGSSEGAGTAGTIGSALTGSYGALTMAADGTYTYVAGSSAGTDSFNYTVTDEFGATDIATLTITVNSSNAAPTASNSTVHINENNQVSTAGDRTPLNITKVFAPGDFNFSDTDDDSLSKVKITTLESAGTLEYYNGSSWTDVTEDQEITAANITSGYLRFTPAANSEDDVTFSFKVHDGTEYSSSAYTMTISVNAAPYVTNVTHSGNVAAGATTSSADIHGVINSTDTVADSDDDDSVLVVTGVAAGNESTNNTIITDDTGVGGDGIDGTYGTLTVAADGTYTYTASATNSIAYDATDTDTFTFTTRDDEGSSGNAGSHAYDVGTITFTVASSISLTNDNDTATEGTAITVTGAQDDVLNDDTADTDGLVVTNISHDNGSESVSSGTTYANGASLAGDYGTLVIGADGSYTFTPNDVLGASETGTDVFTYTADGATATLSIEVTGINDAPTALDNSITTNEDTNHVFSTGEFNFSDDDNSGSLNKIKITSLEDNGALQYYNGSTWVDVTENQEITAADITSGYLRFKPDANENGDDYTSFEFQVSDGTAYSSSSSTMTINVTPVNDAPVAANNTGTILEDGTLTVNDGDGANSSGGVTDDGQTADISNEETSVSGLSFNNDGTKMFVSGGQSDTVHEYSLSTAFDVSTKSATANESYSDASNYDWTRGHTWNADGTKLFIIDNDEGESWQKILEHTVQTAFDLSSTVTRTNTYDLVAPSGGSIPTRPKGITFNSDGTKMYIADHATDKIHQFTLSVGFDLTSTVVNSGTLDVSSQNDSPYGVEFSQDGSKVFVVGNGTQGDAVYQYTLNTAWDITSTATYNDSFNLSSQDSVPADIRFNNDGTKMFIAGSNGNEIDEYTLSTPFEIASISGDHDGDVLVDDS